MNTHTTGPRFLFVTIGTIAHVDANEASNKRICPVVDVSVRRLHAISSNRVRGAGSRSFSYRGIIHNSPRRRFFLSFFLFDVDPSTSKACMHVLHALYKNSSACCVSFLLEISQRKDYNRCFVKNVDQSSLSSQRWRSFFLLQRMPHCSRKI